MRLFGKVDGEINRFDRAEWLTPPFDLAFAAPPEPGELPDEDLDIMTLTTSHPFRLKCVGEQFLSDIPSATELTLPTGWEWGQIAEVHINAQEQDVRYWLSASSPTSNTGALIKAGQTIRVNSPGQDIRLIRTTSGAKAAILYFASQQDSA